MTKQTQAAICVDSCTPTTTRRARKRLLREIPIRPGFMRMSKKIHVERAVSKDELLQVARMLYSLYLAQNFICERPSRYYLRPWHLTPAAAVYTAKHTAPEGEVIAGSCTLIEDTDAAMLPADRLYAKELESLRSSGALLSEASCFAVSPLFRRTTATTELMRAIFAHALRRKFTHLVCIVSTKQRGFYSHLGFSQLGPQRNYSPTHIDPVVLMIADLEEVFGPMPLASDEDACEAKGYWTTNNPYVALIDEWMKQAMKSLQEPSWAKGICDACPEITAEMENRGRAAFTHDTATFLEQPRAHRPARALAS